MGSPPRWMSEWPQAARLSLIFALVILGPLWLGWCGCTMFALASVAWMVVTALFIGNSGFASLTSEREKKTLDSLRLTQLSSFQIIKAKIRPELQALVKLSAAMAPTVILAAWLAGYGWFVGLSMAALGFATGIFSAIFGVFVSSLFDTTSRAVVAGWAGKGVWLLLTPLLDTIAGAVLVVQPPPPIFSSLNPLVAAKVLLLPEASSGVMALLPWVSLLALQLVAGGMFVYAARRFDNGLSATGGVYDTRHHRVYRQGWGPAFVRNRFGSNPSFLRELAFQFRSGAGRWPGYAVFLVLFLAPFLYAKSWSVKEAVRRADRPTPVVEQVALPSSLPAVPSRVGHEPTQHRRVAVRTRYGETLILEGHSPNCCLRLHLNRAAGVPLPKNTRKLIAYRQMTPDDQRPTTTVPYRPDGDTDSDSTYSRTQVRSQYGDSYAASRAKRLHNRSLGLGLGGAVMLLMLYLAIRCSGFLATAVSGERDRRSWENLALTGIGVDTVLSGKVAGALALPLTQMTLCFPALLFFVYTGNLTIFEVLGLYLFAVLVAVTAALVGLYSSATSTSSHQAHGRCLALSFSGFVLLPVLFGLGFKVLFALAAFAMGALYIVRGRDFYEANAWAGLGLGLLMNAKAASPLTAVVSFMPTLAATQVSFLQSLAAGLTGLPLFNWLAAVMVLVSASYLLWKATLRHLSTDESLGIRADA